MDIYIKENIGSVSKNPHKDERKQEIQLITYRKHGRMVIKYCIQKIIDTYKMNKGLTKNKKV